MSVLNRLQKLYGEDAVLLIDPKEINREDEHLDVNKELLDLRIASDGTKFSTASEALQNQLKDSLTYKGTMGKNNIQNLNNIMPQTIYLRETNYKCLNSPTDLSGIIITIGIENGVRYQLYVDRKGTHYDRYSGKNGIWGGGKYWSRSNMQFIRGLPFGTPLSLISSNSLYIIKEGSAPDAPTNNEGIVQTFGERTGFAYQIFTENNGVEYFRYRDSESNWKEWSKPQITFCGTLPPNANLDDINIQTIYLKTKDLKNSYINLPSNNEGIIQTFGEKNGFAYQIFTENNGVEYFRYRDSESNWKEWSKPQITFCGTLPPNTDLDDIKNQSIYVKTKEFNNPNSPIKRPGFIYTLGFQDETTQQFYVSFYDGKTYYRRRTVSGIWKNWKLQYNSIGNKNAKMRSIGNSILTGSVWINEKFDHISSIHNAPYYIVAEALNIKKENVKHTLRDGAGLLYEGDKGSLLSNILKDDLSEYDVLLTHLYTKDMEKFNVGSINSVANDGTLAGGVISLCEYISENYPRCQLILASVVPVSYKIYGENIFDTPFPNGSTINELNCVIESLSKKYHFDFITWNDLNLSYIWQDFTDGNNMHANNEKIYRILGAYLGGKASSKIRF